MKQSVFRSKEAFIEAFSSRMIATYQKEVSLSSVRERFNILGTLVREHIAFDWIKTNELLEQNDGRIVHYFSIEFLLGRLITNNLMNLGLWDVVNEAFNELGIDLNEVEIYESDPGLGNGGLGRLAACFLDSLARSFGVLTMPSHQYGLFRQKIKNGYQEERPDSAGFRRLCLRVGGKRKPKTSCFRTCGIQWQNGIPSARVHPRSAVRYSHRRRP